jgi:hypothetical protein
MNASTRARVSVLAALLAGSLAVSCHSPSGQSSPSMSEDRNLQERIATLTRQEQVLSVEVSVAKDPDPYVCVDFLTGKIELRAQGRSLRSFPIRKVSRSGGSPSAAQTWEETEARPLQLPERARLVPGSGEETTASIAAQNHWGPTRMPLDFDLICKESRLVEIRSLPSVQSRSRVVRWIIGGFRQSRDWARDVFGKRKSAYRESLEIWLSEDHAQLLFWSLPKQFNILILNAS